MNVVAVQWSWGLEPLPLGDEPLDLEEQLVLDPIDLPATVVACEEEPSATGLGGHAEQ